MSGDEMKQFVPPLLQSLYMSEAVEEQGFFEWSRKSSSRYVGSEKSKLIHAASKPFMDWLKEADEEESDDESSPEPVEAEDPESDLHVDFTNTARAGVVEVVKPVETNKEEQLDDLDIDAI